MGWGQRLAARHHLHHAPILDPQFGHRGVEPDLATMGADVLGHLLPHLAWAIAGVVEFRDQRLDLVAAIAEERCLGGREERQPLDSLRGPLRPDLGAGHAPHLLGVGLEEQVEQALAEAV